MDLVDLGEGYVLLFKLSIYLALISIFFYGINIYKVVVNFKGNFCHSSTTSISGSDLKLYNDNNLPPCNSDWVNPHSLANYGLDKSDLIESALMVAYLAFFWVAIGFIYRKIIDICKAIDEANDTPCDWTLMIKGIPTDQDTDAIINNLLSDSKFSAIKNSQVKKVSLAFNLDEYIKLSDKIAAKKNLIKKLQAKEIKSKSVTSLPELQELKLNQPSVSQLPLADDRSKRV